MHFDTFEEEVIQSQLRTIRRGWASMMRDKLGWFGIILNGLFSNRSRQEVRDTIDHNTFTSWWEEIKNLAATPDERELFLNIVDAMINNPRAVRKLVQEAWRSPRLSSLRFLQAYRELSGS